MRIVFLIWAHLIMNCKSLRYKILDLIDIGVVNIDLPNQKYEINDPLKARYLNLSKPSPGYSTINPSIIGDLKSYAPISRNQPNLKPHMPEALDNKMPRIKPILIIGGKESAQATADHLRRNFFPYCWLTLPQF